MRKKDLNNIYSMLYEIENLRKAVNACYCPCLTIIAYEGAINIYDRAAIAAFRVACNAKIAKLRKKLAEDYNFKE